MNNSNLPPEHEEAIRIVEACADTQELWQQVNKYGKIYSGLLVMASQCTPGARIVMEEVLKNLKKDAEHNLELLIKRSMN